MLSRRSLTLLAPVGGGLVLALALAGCHSSTSSSTSSTSSPMMTHSATMMASASSSSMQ